VLLDEPWEGLDAATCDIIAAELTRRMADGTQIICASHSGPAGLDFNRALSLEAGVLKRADDSAEPHENSASEPTLAAGCPPR
jgi:ABC-type transport system involved in cytochrome bd biosynthesis fused ATPase/permease subunit